MTKSYEAKLVSQDGSSDRYNISVDGNYVGRVILGVDRVAAHGVVGFEKDYDIKTFNSDKAALAYAAAAVVNHAA